MRKNCSGQYFLLPNRIFDERLSTNEFIVYSFLVGKGLGGAKFLVGAYDCKKLFDVCIHLQKSFAFVGKRWVHNELKAIYRRRAKEQSIHGQQDLMHRALWFIDEEYERL